MKFEDIRKANELARDIMSIRDMVNHEKKWQVELVIRIERGHELAIKSVLEESYMKSTVDKIMIALKAISRIKKLEEGMAYVARQGGR